MTTGEGALDPLGLATIGDRLADQILPGLRVRMSRPRFVTAIAVVAAACEGMEDRVAADEVTLRQCSDLQCWVYQFIVVIECEALNVSRLGHG